MEIVLDEENVVHNITPQDLEVNMSFGFVVRCRMGSLVALRATLEKIFGGNFTYPTLSSSPLFVVHWNDLSDKKKLEIDNKKRR